MVLELAALGLATLELVATLAALGSAATLEVVWPAATPQARPTLAVMLPLAQEPLEQALLPTTSIMTKVSAQIQVVLDLAAPLAALGSAATPQARPTLAVMLPLAQEPLEQALLPTTSIMTKASAQIQVVLDLAAPLATLDSAATLALTPLVGTRVWGMALIHGSTTM